MPSRVYTRFSTDRNLMTEMETLSILILAWLRWKEVSTLTTSSIEFVRPLAAAPAATSADVGPPEMLSSLGRGGRIMETTDAAVARGGGGAESLPPGLDGVSPA